MKHPQTVFIVGAARSGTGLLQAVLAASPATHPALHDCHYIRSQMEVYARWKLGMFRGGFGRDGFVDDYFPDRTAYDVFTTDILRGILRSTRVLHKISESLVLKCPQLGCHVRDLARLLPESRFIISVRHPFDVMASLALVEQKRSALQAATQAKSDPKSLEGLSRHVDSYYEELMRDTDDPVLSGRVHFVRYEELTRKTSRVLADLEKFTGFSFEGFDPSAAWNSHIDYDARARSRHLSPFATPLYNGKITDERVGSYQSFFTEMERVELIRTPSKCLQWFGYSARDCSFSELKPLFEKEPPVS